MKEQSIRQKSTLSRPRWALAAAILVAAVAAVLWVLYGFQTPRESQRTLALFAVLAVSALLILVWLLVFSRLSWRVRWVALGLVLGFALAAGLLLEVRGVTGDLVPVVGWRWGESSAADREAADRAVLRATADAKVPASAPWPQFLGPRRNAVAASTVLGRNWQQRPPEVVWRRPVGEGWSSFVVTAGLLLTQEQRGENEVLAAYELADGRERWVHAVASRFESSLGGIGPRATPLVVGRTVFAFGAQGRLDAVDLDTGSPRWSREVVVENGGAVPPWGVAASPLAVGEAVVVASGGPGATLVAYRQADGERLWSAGERAPSYSSPLLATFAGREQLILLSSDAVSAFSPRDGALLWEHPWPAGQPNVAQPVVLSDDRLLISTGYGIGSEMLRLEVGADGTWAVRSLWKSPRLKAKFTQIVEYEGNLYGLDDGVLTCIDGATGTRRWKRGRYGHGQVLRLGELLLVMAEDGDLILVELSAESLRELGRQPLLSSKIWAPPAVAGRLLAVRNDREAVLVALPEPEPITERSEP